MNIKYVSKYQKHGCSFSGNLALVEYQKDMERDPRNGTFGSMTVFDYTEKAKKMITDKHPNAEILLAAPDCVARID